MLIPLLLGYGFYKKLSYSPFQDNIMEICVCACMLTCSCNSRSAYRRALLIIILSILHHLEIHYEKALPSAVWTECKPKKYVTNHKYGNHFVTRYDHYSCNTFLQISVLISVQYQSKYRWEYRCKYQLIISLLQIRG